MPKKGALGQSKVPYFRGLFYEDGYEHESAKKWTRIDLNESRAKLDARTAAS